MRIYFCVLKNISKADIFKLQMRCELIFKTNITIEAKNEDIVSYVFLNFRNNNFTMSFGRLTQLNEFLESYFNEPMDIIIE